jgi:hypothetical protein
MATVVQNEEELFQEIYAAYNSTLPENAKEWEILDSLYQLIDEIEAFTTESGDSFVAVEREGGGEGSGEDCHFVFKWNGKHYKLEYSYYSHHGYEFNGALYEVDPVQKMITVYE